MILSLLSEPMLLLPILLSLLIAFTVHEFAHAYVADRLGDPTPKSLGRLTLNPLSHLHPIGFLMLITVGFGFGKPVPYDDRYLKNPKWGAAWIGLAGPISNLILAFAAILILVLLVSNGMPQTSLLYLFLLFLAQFNVALMVFNLLPIHPLDGSKVFDAIVHDRYDNIKVWLANYGPFLLLMLILLDATSPISVFGRLFQFVLSGLEGIVLFLVRLS